MSIVEAFDIEYWMEKEEKYRKESELHKQHALEAERSCALQHDRLAQKLVEERDFWKSVAIKERAKTIKDRPDPTGQNRVKLPLSDEQYAQFARKELERLYFFEVGCKYQKITDPATVVRYESPDTDWSSRKYSFEEAVKENNKVLQELKSKQDEDLGHSWQVTGYRISAIFEAIRSMEDPNYSHSDAEKVSANILREMLKEALK